MQRTTRALARLVPVWLGAVLAASLLPGCDNPACVYTGNCFGGGSGGGLLGDNPATVPGNDAWLLPGQPVATGFQPTGTTIASTTPIVVRFSESLTPASANGAFELRPQDGGGFGGPPVSVPLLPPAVIGDGRVVVLLPALPLENGKAYDLRLKDTAIVYDLTGSPLKAPTDGLFGSFTVADADPSLPRVVASWPLDASADQSPTTEVVVVFDRRVQESSVTVESFAVKVGGVTPPQNPAPQPALFSGGSGLPSTDTRAWTWRSVDNQGLAVPLGLGASVDVSLSPTGHKILAEDDGAQVPATQFDFTLASIGSPLAAEIVSLPLDAIGIANLDGTRPLEVAVEIENGLSSDLLGVFVFGTTTSATPQLAALYRQVRLSDAGFDPLTGIATLGADLLDLTTSTSPVQARFADGTVAFALNLVRGSVTTPVRLLDVDRDAQGIQSPRLDTTRPVLEALGTQGSSLTSARSDLRDLVVVGRASEPVRSAEVVTALGDNGMLPPAIVFDAPAGTQDQGLFVAAPVPLGILPPAELPLDFTVLVYDLAFNEASVATTASLTQLGASGPGAALPGNPTVSVEVFDAASLAPIPGALVFTHGVGGGPPAELDVAATDVEGRVTLLAAISRETLVTVDAPGYDLFSFQAVPTSRLGVPLTRTLAAPAIAQGLFTTTDAGVTGLDKVVFDSRLLASLGQLVEVQSCSFNPLQLRFDCTWGPAALAADRLGSVAAQVIDPPASEFGYTAAGFLKAWTANLPAPPVEPENPSGLVLSLDRTLDAAGTPQEERALDGPAVDADASGLVLLDLGNLVGEPLVTVEARVRGLAGALLAGGGVAFPLAGAPPDTWRLRCAFPGAVDFTDDKYPEDQLGVLVADGIIDPDLFLRLELVDQAGNASLRRPRFSALPSGGSLFPLDVPAVLAPAPGSTTAGTSYPITLEDVFDGSLGPQGLYHVTLTGSNGRRWELWRPDGPDPTVTLWTAPIDTSGGTPLPAGPVGAQATALTWPSLDVAAFLWSDIERELDARVTTAPWTFSQP